MPSRKNLREIKVRIHYVRHGHREYKVIEGSLQFINRRIGWYIRTFNNVTKIEYIKS